MSQTGAMEDVAAADGAGGKSSSSAAGLRSRPGSSERDALVRAVKAALQSRLGPYEPLLTYLQSMLVWERPFQCLLLYVLVNVVFWFFALTTLRLLFLLACGLAALVCVDAWRNKIWPKLRVRNQDECESESWGLVQPGILSVPELCHHVAEAWVSAVVVASNLAHFKRFNPGRFCILTCCLFSSLAVIGRYIPGLVLSYSAVLVMLLAPLAAYHRVFQRVFVKLEPVLQRLDFSVCGYMMSKPLDNQFLRMPLHGVISGEGSDSEEELAAFCPTFDDIVVAKELALTDSEHSDAEVSYTDNGTFNLSRGQTPLTEGSEELERHSDAEESFAQDLPDFPSINPDATLMDDDDDTSIGLPSLALSGLQSHRTSVLDVDAHLDSDQEDLDAEMSLSGLPPASDFMGDLAGDIASNMIRAALVGAMQPRRPSAQHRQAPPKAGAHRSYRKQSSSELDTDFDVEDFEMLDQSELSQMDPVGEGQRRESQGSNFLSSLNEKNRPYSSQDVFCNLQKQHGLGKTAVVKSMELLALEGKIKEKIYGKQKVYFADQSQFKDVNDADLKVMDSHIAKLNEEMQVLNQSCRHLEAELKGLNNSLTSQEMTSEITRLRNECSECHERLDKIKSATDHVAPEEKDKVLKEHNVYVKEWRKRKRLASDMMDTILEGYPKSKKEFLEEVGVETDEDYQVVVPTV